MSKDITKFIYKDFSESNRFKKGESDFASNNNSDFYGVDEDVKDLGDGFFEGNKGLAIDRLKQDSLRDTNIDDYQGFGEDFLDKVDSENENINASDFSEDSTNNKNDKIEQIKKEAYDFGYDDCKIYMEKVLSEYKINSSITETLDIKIKEINILEDRTQELFSFCVEMLKLITSKIYAKAPNDFEKVLVDGMFKYVKKNFKSNKIEIVVHPNKVGYSNNVLQVQDLPEKIKNHISITGEEGLGIDDCYIKYEDTVLKYDRSSIEKEIDEVLSRL